MSLKTNVKTKKWEAFGVCRVSNEEMEKKCKGNINSIEKVQQTLLVCSKHLERIYGNDYLIGCGGSGWKLREGETTI